jgi:hypothetical protein
MTVLVEGLGYALRRGRLRTALSDGRVLLGAFTSSSDE